MSTDIRPDGDGRREGPCRPTYGRAPRIRPSSSPRSPDPDPDDDELVVDVHALGVGIHDRSFIPTDGRFPYAIGTEGAGVVVATGPGVGGVRVGDRVMVSTVLAPKGGTWAEQVVVSEAAVTGVPEDLNLVTAAGIPVAGKTAVECVHALDLEAVETLFVAGATGAIGTLLVQMAAKSSVDVIGSASAPNHDYLRSLGASLAVDYRDPSWQEQVRRHVPGGVDAAVAIQPGTPAPSQAMVRDGGLVVTVSGDPCTPERGIRVTQFEHRQGPDVRKEMADLVDDIAAGRIDMVLEHVYPFEEAIVALEKTETRHARGKLAVRVR